MLATVPRAVARGPRVIHSPRELPVRVYRHMFAEMAAHLSGSAAARDCSGLSFAFRLVDRDDVAVRYEVAPGGVVRIRRSCIAATFTFSGASDDIDAVLTGALNPLPLTLCRRIGFRGSLLKLRRVLVMLPALRSTYLHCRGALRLYYASEFDLQF